MEKTNKAKKAQGANIANYKVSEVSRETLEEAIKQEPALEQFREAGEQLIKQYEKIETIKNMVETDEVQKKERKKGSSTIYLLKAFKHHINSLATQKVCTLEEIQSLREIHKKATQRWIGLELDGEQ